MKSTIWSLRRKRILKRLKGKKKGSMKVRSRQIVSNLNQEAGKEGVGARAEKKLGIITIGIGETESAYRTQRILNILLG